MCYKYNLSFNALTLTVEGSWSFCKKWFQVLHPVEDLQEGMSQKDGCGMASVTSVGGEASESGQKFAVITYVTVKEKVLQELNSKFENNTIAFNFPVHVLT